MARRSTVGLLVGFAGVAGLSQTASAQAFGLTPSKIPGTGGHTENVDFADVDHDGDFDMILAQGGDAGDEQNNIWINRGFEAGGTLGFFVDRTATQFPAVLDQSRDIEFADIDNDGDVDIYVSNTSQISNQSNRWWINMGGAQAGVLGFYVDQSSTRWVGLNVAPTSVPASFILPAGFIDWSCDCDFGDLDNDGDLDLVHSTYGGAFLGDTPTRLFLNNGAGLFNEFNPSGFRLTSNVIPEGAPGLWAQGLQQSDTTNNTGVNADVASSALDIDVMDIDGDLDLDILHGAREEAPRMFRNRLVQNGGVLTTFTDITTAAFPPGWSSGNGHYEQEMGDCDNDNDLDLYGLNWQVGAGFNDITMRNNGAGVFSNLTVLSGSGADDNEGDFLDYENDGDLDLYVANFSGQDKLYRNDYSGAGFSYTNVTSTQLPTLTRIALDADCADLDNDGDTDVIVANDNNAAQYYLTNNTNVADTRAPRPANLEQAPNRTSGANPTVVRVQVYDNASYYETWYINIQLEYRVLPTVAYTQVTMQASQGQIWRGLIPGNLVGTIEYRVRATDRRGNVGVSATKNFTASAPPPVTYCTTSTTSAGCNPAIGFIGTPSLAAPSGFTITVAGVEGQRAGLTFYGISGRNAAPWAPGNTSTLCVKAPTQRMGTQNSGGTAGACNGSFSEDWLNYLFTHPGSLGQPFAAGSTVNGQSWFRDPSAPGTTNLSNGLEWVTLP